MEKNKLYVGNLSFEIDDSKLREIFGSYGEITDLAIITDRDTGRSKGFAFITFESNEAAEKAIEQDGKEYEGRPLKVNMAKERTSRGGGGYGGGNRGGGGGGYGGGGGRRDGRNDRSRW